MTIVLKGAVPVLPAKNVAEAVAFYRDKLGFMPLFDMGNYAGVGRGPVEFHLDGSDASAKPISARVNLEGVDALHDEINPKGIVMPTEPLETKPWGLRQFSVLDPFGNRITFAQAAR